MKKAGCPRSRYQSQCQCGLHDFPGQLLYQRFHTAIRDAMLASLPQDTRSVTLLCHLSRHLKTTMWAAVQPIALRMQAYAFLLWQLRRCQCFPLWASLCKQVAAEHRMPHFLLSRIWWACRVAWRLIRAWRHHSCSKLCHVAQVCPS